MFKNILEVKNLEVRVKQSGLRIVKDISFNVREGEVLAIVGESGSGKSITAKVMMGLLSKDTYKIDGSIMLQDKDLTQMNELAYQKVRGNDIAMIFQEPMTSLNPVLTIGSQLKEAIKRNHPNMPRKQLAKEAVHFLNMVQIPKPEMRLKQYPFEMSGGMRQRVLIAMALVGNPKILIADEPTTALDVTVQADIIKLLISLQKKLNMSILFISHDLGVVSQIANRILVMYSGDFIELGEGKDILNNPLHPYTEGLIDSIPSLYQKEDVLKSIPGQIPGLADGNHMKGCLFYNRCSKRLPSCNEVVNEVQTDGHTVRCNLYAQNDEEVKV
ncbi:ABC transporter ATP-binding protein [Oceanobacillus oncorhynchi]|uniref:ABC transporter ATP-binding protein n=1 Tax=Oceanobacillus oncorhynchi TaxID=545501 RepID=UPI001868BE24|nr:ABC transporter ATP-binding protein [Oceanobacillus oncorhynchi]